MLRETAVPRAEGPAAASLAPAEVAGPAGAARMPEDRRAVLRTDPSPSPAPKRIVVIASLTRSLVNFRFELLAAMAGAGHQVTAFAPDEDADAIGTLGRAGIAFRRIPMARTGMNPLGDLRCVAAIYREIRRLSPDLVLAYTMKPIIYGGLAGRLAGVRRRFAMFTGFGFVFGDDRRGLRASALRRLGVWLYRLALKGSEAVFVYNDADEREIKDHAMIGARTAVVPVAGSGVDLRRFAGRPLPDGPPVFLLVARLLREKGIAEFASAARILKAEHPRARFQVLGPFDPSPLGFAREEIERWGEEGCVEYLGETSDVAPFLARATVFVLPSYYREGIPRSALEALATGRPIVTTDMPGCRETVIDGVNGFRIPPRSVEALASAMRAFLDDGTLAGPMGAASRALAEERFDVHSIVRTVVGSLGLQPTAR